MTDVPPPVDSKDLLAIGLGGPTDGQTPRWTPPAPSDLPAIPNLKIGALLGSGGMGAVYRARQTHLERTVALKILDPARGADAAFAERFAREARAMARLDHPAIVRLYDYGQTGTWPWLVMELVEGANLRDVLRTGKLSATEALRIAPLLCEALAHAHAAGIVHRDLKPENILIDAQGRPHIADFGLAKLADAGSSLTATGQGCGTAVYMAPEQVSGAAEVDHRADLYALGVILYEMLTGSLPLGLFAPPSQTAGVDQRLDEVVLKSLEREPGKRWQSAAEVQRAVEQASVSTSPNAVSESENEAISLTWRGIRVRGPTRGGFDIGWNGIRFFRPLHNQSSSTTLEGAVAPGVYKMGPWDGIFWIISVLAVPLIIWTSLVIPLPSHSAQTPASIAPRGVITVATATPGRHYLVAWADSLPTGRTWHIQTRVRWHDVQGQAYMESEQHFADGGVIFTRTLADSGPKTSFTGSSNDWREVVLPCDASSTSAALSKVQVTLIMAGAGTVEIETPRLIEGLPR